MEIHTGRVLLTAGLLNEIAAPFLKKRYRFIKELSFRIVEGLLVAEIAGRYNFFRFKAFAGGRLIEFTFRPSLYRIEMEISIESRPAFIKPLLLKYLDKRMARYPGVHWSGSQLILELAEMHFFVDLRKRSAWSELFSRLRIVKGKENPEGIPFEFYLEERV